MNFLLDTHTVLWLAENSPQLSQRARETILGHESKNFISIASAWEIAIKNSVGKFTVTNGVTEFYKMVESNGFIWLPIKQDHIVKVESLPFHHRDPFDRLLVAAAICDDLAIITADRNIPAYGVPCVW